MLILQALGVGIAAASLVAAQTQDIAELHVSTRTGRVLGHWKQTTAITGKKVREFLGIPYGQPAIGDLRFAAPKKAKPWKTVLNATQFGPACYPTKFLGNLGDSPISLPPPLALSEDCLSVNVWAPNLDRVPRDGATVMIYTYGGGFVLGASDSPAYNGANLVNNQDGVIFVSFNYRISLFGFPGALGLPAKEKNPGLLDVRLAVEWVRDNIGAFGGNPKKILLFGESAGASATDAYTFFSKDDPIIRAAILQSGVTNGATNATLPIGASFANLSTAVGCPADDAAESLKCVRSKPVTELVDKVNSLSLRFTPLPDDGTVFRDQAARLARGEFAKIPMLIGSNDQEIPGTTPAAIQGTKLTFTCSAARSALARTQYVPTWMYRYFGNFPANPNNLSPGPYHGSEIPQVFGNYNVSLAPPEQKLVSQYIQGAWVAFAKDPKNGLRRYSVSGGKKGNGWGPGARGWPTYDYEKKTLIGLAVGNAPNATLLDPKVYNSGCP